MAAALPNLLCEDPLRFWPRLAAARRRFLGLDYDGTLAPFQVDRMAAVPVAGAADALRELVAATGTEAAIISGRLAEEVVQLLGEPGVTVIGSHGYERLAPGGDIEQVALAPHQTRGLALAQEQVARIGLQHRLERKVSSLAFHTRGLSASEAKQLEEQVLRLWETAAEEGLSCRPFDGGVELRALDVDKGTVLAELLDRAPGAFAAYVGDDLTDEDAFRVVRRYGGTGIVVGAPSRPTAATAWLPDPQAVVQFLLRWRSEAT
jgi:trehalose 6-phosphate phosphatase